MASISKIHLNDTPLFKEVASVIGKHNTLIELGKVWRARTCMDLGKDSTIDSTFTWLDTPQGIDFWLDICRGRNPYGEHHEH